MRILSLGKQFRPGTSHVYPPFKNGRYMEEYVYEYLITHHVETNAVYIPIFWTNLQNHPGFLQMKSNYTTLLQKALNEYPIATTTYFTVVQHDDGPQLDLPSNTIIFGACTGTIPLPLIYEDVSHTLEKKTRVIKDILASFIGSITHPIREHLITAVENYDTIVCQGKKGWTPIVSDSAANQYVTTTLRSKFCLAPRGYGRSSFRFFEAMLLDTIPVYIWDDTCWLPYQEYIDYSTFAVCIHEKDLHRIHEILSKITDSNYAEMMESMQKIRSIFTLKWMCEYICSMIKKY